MGVIQLYVMQSPPEHSTSQETSNPGVVVTSGPSEHEIIVTPSGNAVAVDSGNVAESGIVVSPGGTSTGTTTVGPSGLAANSTTDVDPSKYSIVDLEGNVLFYTPEPLKSDWNEKLIAGDNNGVFDALIAQQKDVHGRLHDCLRTAATMDEIRSRKFFGLPGFRAGYANVDPSKTGIVEAGRTTPNKSIDSWDLPKAARESGNYIVMDLPENRGDIDFMQFPYGTVFTFGHEDKNKYLADPYQKGENGRILPSHTVVLTGWHVDKNGTTTPIFSDYDDITENDGSPLYNRAPTNAIIPKGKEALTYANLTKNGDLVALENLRNSAYHGQFYTSTNEFSDEITKVDPRLAVTISAKYNIPLEEAFKRLIAIGKQESNFGYDSGYVAKEVGGAPVVNTLKYFRQALKPASGWDTKAAWQHEVEIFNKLKNEGLLEGKSDDEIRKLVADQFNKEKDEADYKYGELTPAKEDYNNSHGYFQLKDDPYTDEIYNRLSGSTGRKNDKDAITRAFNRFGYLYAQLAHKYPNLTQEQLLNAATIAWNAPSKVSSQEFIDNYITNTILRDSYLDKILDHEKTLYRRLGGRLISRPKFNRGGTLSRTFRNTYKF